MYIPFWGELITGFQYITEEFVDTCKECKNIIQDGFEDIHQDIEQGIVDKAYCFGVGKSVSKHYKKKNKRRQIRKNLNHSIRNLTGSIPGQIVTSTAELRKGDHLCVSGYGDIISHHAIYIGKGKVIHYAPDGMGMIMIRVDAILYEILGGKVRLLKEAESYCKYSRKKVLSRAFSRLGEEKYNILTNNCEHFARWARCGGDIY